MLQEEEDIELAPKERGDEQKKKAKGEELRKRACETLGETRQSILDTKANAAPVPLQKGSKTKGQILLHFWTEKWIWSRR